MLLSVATATFYFLPFAESIQTIALAGYENIELDLYWERKQWAMAQHLKHVSPREAVDCIAQAGLKVSSIHDGGGVLDNNLSIAGFINPALDGYLDCLGYAPDCLVFHTPHIEGEQDPQWWGRTSAEIVRGLAAYQRYGSSITIENMPEFEGYTVAITSPEALNDYALAHGLGVTLDTTHCAQSKIELVAAAQTLRETIRTVHLSDFRPGAPHAFIGDGELDLGTFFKTLDLTRLKAITLECGLAAQGQSERDLSQAERVDQLILARKRLEGLLQPANQENEGPTTRTIR
jgi:sugar phosphate isomerase/epimerase